MLSAIHAVRALALPADLWEKTVVSIRLESDSGLRLEDFTQQITQKVGQPLEPSKVSESLKNLFATGRFHELRAEGELRDSGVELVFVSRAQYFVGMVRVEGSPHFLEPRNLVAASRLRLGQPLGEAELVAADERLKALLAENGYHEAKVGHRVSNDLKHQEADVAFAISPGRPAVLGGVEFQGHPLFPPGRLLRVAGWKSGRLLTSAKVEQGRFKIHQFYLKRGWLQSTVNVQARTYDAQRHIEKLAVQVEAGPRIKVRVQGARVSSSKMKDLLPMFKDGVTDDVALDEGKRNLENYFEKQGYYSASVKWERRTFSNPERLEITYTVNSGPAGEFVGYSFQGNKAVPSEELVQVLSLQPKTFFRDPGVFSHDLLDHDVKALSSLYESKGFLEARVTPHSKMESGSHLGRLSVTFEINEGQRTKVRNVAFKGVDTEMQKALVSLVVSKWGEPYSPSRVQADRDAILEYCLDRGYSQASVDSSVSPATPEHETDVEYEIRLGLQERIRRVVVMGSRHTRPSIVRRELSLREGKPLGRSNLLESQRRLYDLGVFNQVQIATQDPLGDETERTLLVSLEEARRWTLGYGGGVEVQRLGSNQPEGQFKASPRVSLDLSRIDVGGRPQIFTLRGRLSNLERGGAVGYFIPHFTTRGDLNLRLNALVDRSRDVLTFTAKRQEASVSVEKTYSHNALLQARFSYRRIQSTDVRIRPELVPLVSRPARVGMLSLGYINDHRDNPVDATKGSYSLADAGVSWQRLGSEADFARLLGQNSTYYRLARHLIFARNTRLAIESKFGRPGPTNQIPLPERFFMGGSESHRGFSINQAGPRDPLTGFPLGGNALFLNSLELRMPFAENRLGFVLFHDAGNVYSSIRRMRLLKVMQTSPLDFDYTGHAVGLGFRYKTPVGPLRFDVGYSLNPVRFQVQTLSGLEVRRLPRFQFFLGVGQTF